LILNQSTGLQSNEPTKEEHMDAYCVKCKEKVEVKDPKDVKMKNGRDAVSGTCSKCGTKVFKIKSKSDA
jgi:RNase P subunit RPR2